MSLDQETRTSTVLYRIEKAQSTWDDAMFCIESRKWNMASNRLYYAVFHAASALLISKGIVAGTHRGFLSQVSLHLVRTGIITKEQGKLIRHLFDLRHEGDYEDFVEVDEEDINRLLPDSKELIERLKQLVTNNIE